MTKKKWDGPAKPGEVRNPDGRPPIKMNYAGLIRKRLEESGVLEDLIALAQGAPDRITGKPLEPELRVRIMEKFLNKVVPDLKAVDMKVTDGRPMVIIKDMTGLGKEDIPIAELRHDKSAPSTKPVIDLELEPATPSDKS